MASRVFVNTLGKLGYLATIREGLDYIGFKNLVLPGSRIFIKPNLTFPEYRPGVMTNPEAIEAAIIALKDYTANILIGDSDSGGYNRFSMDEVYDATGIRSFADKYGVQIMNLSREKRKPIHFEYHGKSFSLNLPALLTDEIDFLVTMPVPKIHSNTGVSLTFKNQWGCIPENKDRLRLHPYFQHVILEVNRAVKTKVAIIDGKYGLNIDGPMLGEAVALDWVLVADQFGAAASVACDLMQISLDSIPHLRYARDQGMIPSKDQIELNGSIQPFLKQRFYLRRKLTDYPGLFAFQNPSIAYLAYFSPLADFLHKILNLVRKPFYDYEKYSPRS